MIFNLLIAFSAGFISFLSPCVLPLIPGYISYISGQTLDEIIEDNKSVLLKTADRPDDTERLSAEICDDSGLQILTWQSHIRSLVSATSSHKAILRELKKKHGKPKIKKKSAFWITKEFQIVVKIRSKNKTYQNQIRYFGPQHEPCFEKFKKYKNVIQKPDNDNKE